MQTLVKVWENLKELWKHSSTARVPTAVLVLPNFHACFHNSIETQFMFSISKVENDYPYYKIYLSGIQFNTSGLQHTVGE